MINSYDLILFRLKSSFFLVFSFFKSSSDWFLKGKHDPTLPGHPLLPSVIHLVINRLNKLAKTHGIQQRRTFTKEVKNLRLALRHFRHVKRRAKAKKALKRLRTIAGILIRELRRTLPQHTLFETHQKDFLFYERVLAQQPKDKNKVYSLHEPDVYCIGKGKDHTPYEYGNKVSLASTAKTNIIVGAVSHECNIHDNHTLPDILSHIESSRGKAVRHAVCDRGYRGKKTCGETDIILPAPPLKKDNRYQRNKKRKRCRRRATIEPIIGHLKTDFRLTRNFLKGTAGDSINLLMAACAWNMAKWMRDAILFLLTLILGLKKQLRSVKTRFSNAAQWIESLFGGFVGFRKQFL